MTYHDALKQAERRLKAAGVPEYENDARMMLEAASGKDLARVMLELEEIISPEEETLFEKMVERRSKREPLQYILPAWEFMGLEMYCSPACLIPRQDTELLAMTAISEADRMSGGSAPDGVRVLDMCTGSGCVIISVKKLAKSVCAQGADISAEALEVARRNAEHNGVSVGFILSDMFKSIDCTQYDIITANPPYIETGVIPGLNPEITEYEPMIALDGGEDGLKHYRSIVSEAKHHLRKGGRLLMEIGDTQGEAVSGLLVSAGYEEVEVKKDLAGLDRVVGATWVS